MSNDTRIAVDVAKAVFEIAISDRPGHVSRRERLPRGQFLAFMAQQPEATVVMEACGSAHHWGRKIQGLGHRIVLLPPHHVRPYIRRNKTDRTDAKGILEASRNEEIRPVPVKTVDQQVLTSLHRLRSGWMTERTARLNALRGLLRELGVFIPMGAREVVPFVWSLIEDADSDLPDALRSIFAEACREIREIEALVKQVERQLETTAEQLPAVEHLRTIPGIGLLIATALVAFIGDIRRFPSGRHLASYLGLTPREYSSGLKRNLGRISKRGDGYLRTLLIHGARSVLVHARKHQPDRLREWANNLAKTHVHNKAAVAVANKLARIVWAVWHHQRPFALIAKVARSGHSRQIAPLTQELQDAKSVMVKQVGPAPGQPRTIVALEAVDIDWLPGARIPSWPGVLGDSSNEAGDTFAVRPVSPSRFASTNDNVPMTGQ